MSQIFEKDITFIITTYKSEKLIESCLDSLPIESKKIIVENSSNYKLKEKLEKKYNNLKCYIMDSNLGYGNGNNYGIKNSDTRYLFILNPDAKVNSNTIPDMLIQLKNKKFAIAAPCSLDDTDTDLFKTENIVEMNHVKGFAMLLDKEEMKDVGFFDENFFLYLEEIDLCERVQKYKKKIFLINTPVNHLSGLSHGDRNDIEMEKSRNWHWMWSKFYFNKKHYGYMNAIIKTFPNLISSLIKTLIYSVILNKSKRDIYFMRVKGLLNSYFLSKSYYRPYE
tara:strand:+ start:207 stop:1046 length:840 start_codon:yes stop_codon:yes gene_type:complete